MTEPADLIARLRKAFTGWQQIPIFFEAADLLASVTAERDEAREALAREREECAEICSKPIAFDFGIPGGIFHTESSGPSPLHAAAIRSRTIAKPEPAHRGEDGGGRQP